MIRKALIAALCIVPAFALAEERTYSQGPVTAVTYVKIKPGMFDEYMKHLGGSYRAQMKELQKAGLVTDWKIYTVPARTPTEPDMILSVTYPNMGALDKQTEFDAISNRVAGTFASQNKGYADRGAMREVLGGVLMREQVLK